MGRTLPSATQIFMQEEQSYSRFRRALRRADQLALDELFVSAKQHTAAAQYASHALPFEVMLLAMLLEEHKEVMKLRERVETLSTTRPTGIPKGDDVLRNGVDTTDTCTCVRCKCGGSESPRLVDPGRKAGSLPGF